MKGNNIKFEVIMSILGVVGTVLIAFKYYRTGCVGFGGPKVCDQTAIIPLVLATILFLSPLYKLIKDYISKK